MNKCPKCKARFVKSNGDTSHIFLHKLILNKSDNSLLIACSSCKTVSKPDAELSKSLRNALLLIKE